MKLCYHVCTPEVAPFEKIMGLSGDLESNFALLAEHGYEGVELRPLDVMLLDRDQIRRLAEKHKLWIAMVTTGNIFSMLGVSLSDNDESVRQEAIKIGKQIIDFAHALDADINIGTFRGKYKPDVDKDATYDLALDAFKLLSEYAAPLNVAIGLEPINRNTTDFINTTREGCEMVDKVGCDNFKVQMDTQHMFVEDDVIPTILEYAPKYNLLVHLADSDRCYPGHGEIDFEPVIGAFKQSGYDGAFSIEPFQKPDQITGVKESMRYLEPIFAKYYGWKKR